MGRFWRKIRQAGDIQTASPEELPLGTGAWDLITGEITKGVYEEEPYHEYSLGKPGRITDRLVTILNGNYRIKEPETGGRENIWLWRWVTQYNLV